MGNLIRAGKVLIWIQRLIMLSLMKKNRKNVESEPNLNSSDEKEGKNKKSSIEKDLNCIGDKEIGKKTNKCNLSAQSSDSKSPDTNNKNKKLNNSDSIDKDTQSSISNKNSKTKIRERLKNEKEVRGDIGKVSEKSTLKNTKDQESLGKPKKRGDE